MRNSLTSKVVLMYLAVVLMIFSSVIRILNFSMSLKVLYSGIVFVASSVNGALCIKNVGQFKRK